MPVSADAHQDRLERLAELCRRVSEATDPAEVVSEFGRLHQRIRPSDYFISASVRGLSPGEYKVTRQLDWSTLEAPGADIPDPWSEWDRLPTRRGGFLGEVIARGRPRVFDELRVDDDPVLGDALGAYRSCLARPIYDAGEPLNWAFDFRREPHAYTPSDLDDAFLIANLVGTAARNMLANKENQRLASALRAQFEQVARVQQSLLPRRLPEIPGLRVATSYLTSDEAGGDYFDFLRLPGGRWGILIADVSGHGAAAATVMAMLHAILHGYQGPEFGPASLLRYANQRLLEANIDHTFVTAFFGAYDPATGSMAYARSGHHPPRLKVGATGRTRALEGEGSAPLGIFEDYQIGEETTRFEPGDTLVLYTDGVTEAFSPDRRMFGVEGLDAALERCSGEPDCAIEAVHHALYEHTGARTRDDDQALVVLQRVGTESE